MIIPSSLEKTGGAERQLFILKKKLERNNKILFLSNYYRENKLLFLIKILLFILINSKKIDLIHIHTINSPALVGSLGAKLIGKPSIVKIPRNGLGSSINLYNKNKLGKIYLNILKKIVTNFICLTNFSRKELLSFGFDNEKLVVIPNGVEVKRNIATQAKKDFNCYVFVGRLIKRKKVDEIIYCFKTVFKKKKKKLIIIGDGAELKNLEKIEKSILSKSKVYFLKNKKNSFVQKQLKKSGFFIFNSISEGLSNALLEAMSNSCVVLVRKIKGVNEIITDNKNGIIFKDQKGLVNKLKIYNQKRKLVSLSKNALKTIQEHYSIDFVAKKYIKLYKKLIKNFSHE